LFAKLFTLYLKAQNPKNKTPTEFWGDLERFVLQSSRRTSQAKFDAFATWHRNTDIEELGKRYRHLMRSWVGALEKEWRQRLR